MDNARQFNLIARLTKVDEEKRQVTGVITSETLDKSGEILDYNTSKGAFEKWMAEFKAATKGQSVGNLREMHGKVAAGKFISIEFDDIAKTITGTAEVIDEAAWQKTRLGVYTGFSIGGTYGKTWTDPENEKAIRFTTGEIVETSLVDNPCNPTATFTAIKANGDTEMRKFLISEDFDENEVSKVEQVWLAKDGTTHPTKGKAIRANVLIKAQRRCAEITAPVMAAIEKASADSAEKTAADAEAAAAADEPKTDLTEASAAAGEIAAAAEAEKAAPVAESAATASTEAAPATAAEEAEKTVMAPRLKKFDDIKKGLWSVANLCDLIDGLRWLQSDIEWEAACEQDGSALPDELKAMVGQLCDFLTRLVAEETAEITATDEVVVLELAAMPLNRLTVMLKAVRSSGAIATVAKAITVNAATTKGTNAESGDLNEVIQGAMEAALKKVNDASEAKITELQKQVETLKQLPQAVKGFVRTAPVAVSKSADGGNVASNTGANGSVEGVQAQIDKLPAEDAATLAMKLAMRTRPPAGPSM